MTAPRPTLPLSLSLFLLAAAAPAGGQDLHRKQEESPFRRPLRLRAGQELIDVTNGHSAPAYHDLDGDRLPDLLVGELGELPFRSETDPEGRASFQGRLRFYRNVGTLQRPQFGKWTYVKAGGVEAAVPAQCCVGFVPRLVDLTSDGVADLLSGSDTGQVFLFVGERGGRFAAPRELRFPNGESIVEDVSVTVDAGDLDLDGDPDLLLATGENALYVVENVGTPQRPEAAARKWRMLTDEGRPMFGSDAHAADWDGDGRIDVLVGTGLGGVAWYQNISGENMVRFGPRQWLLPEPPEEAPAEEGSIPRHPGGRVKLCVADYDADGKLDLFLGDFTIQISHAGELPPADRAEIQRLERELSQAARELSDSTKSLANAPPPPPMPEPDWSQYKPAESSKLVWHWWWVESKPGTPKEVPIAPLPAGTREGAPELGRMVTAVEDARKRVEELSAEIRAKLPDDPMYHGWVWVYRRR